MKYSGFDRKLTNSGIAFLTDEPMKKHITFKLGGNAKRFLTVKNEAELSLVLSAVNENKLAYFILGNGSNMLVSDEGFDGVVITLGGEFSEIKLMDSETISCGAGASLSSLCAFARKNSLSGLEFAWGIPGSAGGAAYMNAGAYGGEMKDVLSLCEHMDLNGEKGVYKAEGLELSYRKSTYTNKDLIITKLILKLKKGDYEEINAKMAELMEKRKSKQPLEYPSAGSTFKRPEGYFAAALIEECGLKGEHVGDAEVSVKHSGFIINKGNATCSDVLSLIEKVKEKVKEMKNVELECEVKLLK